MKLNKYIQKVCCFYASDWHLTVMLLPYINNQIKEDKSIYMKCENNIEEKMSILLNKLDLKNKKDILNINWNNKVQEEEINSKDKIYIISGDEEYIQNTNKIIEEYYSKKNINVKIINCYEISEKKNIKNIIEINEYKKILNTQGEKDIDKIVI